MISKIVNLSNQLRQEGLPVSIRSTYSASEVYFELGESDRDLLRTALRAIYVKDRYDIPKFNKIFEEIFKKEKEETELDEIQKKGKAYLGGGPKSNKYIIKKQESTFKKLQKEKLNNEKLRMLSGQPLLDEVKELERDGELMNKDLTKLNRFDPRMLEICQRLGRRIANKRSRRKFRTNSNKIDMRRTIRANLKYGGVPVELVKSKPRPHKNEHLFLNDISGSCEWISSWFFMPRRRGRPVCGCRARCGLPRSGVRGARRSACPPPRAARQAPTARCRAHYVVESPRAVAGSDHR